MPNTDEKKNRVSRLLYNLILVVENNTNEPNQTKLPAFEELLRARLKEAIFELHKPEV